MKSLDSSMLHCVIKERQMHRLGCVMWDSQPSFLPMGDRNRRIAKLSLPGSCDLGPSGLADADADRVGRSMLSSQIPWRAAFFPRPRRMVCAAGRGPGGACAPRREARVPELRDWPGEVSRRARPRRSPANSATAPSAWRQAAAALFFARRRKRPLRRAGGPLNVVRVVTEPPAQAERAAFRRRAAVDISPAPAPFAYAPSTKFSSIFTRRGAAP